MGVALIQSYLPAKLHKKNKQCTTDTAASHPHFTAPLAQTHPQHKPHCQHSACYPHPLYTQGFTPCPNAIRAASPTAPNPAAQVAAALCSDGITSLPSTPVSWLQGQGGEMLPQLAQCSI